MSTSHPGPTFTIYNIYIKDISFEVPSSPFIFQNNWDPQVEFNFSIEHQKLNQEDLNDTYEVCLNFLIKTNLGEKVAFLIEIKQAGVFQIADCKPRELDEIFHITCPTILFPYVRELVNNLVTKGGFPNLLLPPINFHAVHAQKNQEQ